MDVANKPQEKLMSF